MIPNSFCPAALPPPVPADQTGCGMRCVVRLLLLVNRLLRLDGSRLVLLLRLLELLRLRAVLRLKFLRAILLRHRFLNQIVVSSVSSIAYPLSVK